MSFFAIYTILGFISMRRYVWHINGKWTYSPEYSRKKYKYGLTRSLIVAFLGACMWPVVNGVVLINYIIDASQGNVQGSVIGKVFGTLGRGVAYGFKRLMISEPYHEKQKRRIKELEARLEQR